MYKNLFIVYYINIIESFNVSLYGLLFAILPPILFHSLYNNSYFLELTYLTLLIGFLSRPIGGVVLGYIADRHGKILSLKISLICIFLASSIMTIIISNTMGAYTAIVIVSICNMLHGFSVSASYVSLFIIKDISLSTKYLGFLYSCGFLGSLVALLICSIFGASTQLSSIGTIYLVGAISGLIAFALCYFFTKKENKNIEPYKKYIIDRSSLRKIAITIGLSANSIFIFMVSTIYFNKVMLSKNLITDEQVIIFNISYILVWIFALPLSAKILYQINTISLLKITSIILAVISIPIFIMVDSSTSVIKIILVCYLFNILSVIYTSAYLKILTTVFNEYNKAICTNISQGIGSSFFGVVIPYSFELSFFHFHNEFLVTIVVFSIIIISLYSIKYLKKELHLK